MALMDTIQREILEERLEQEMEALSQEMYGNIRQGLVLCDTESDKRHDECNHPYRRKEKGILYFRRIPYRKAAFQQPDKFRGL